MQVTVNGSATDVSPGETVASLLTRLDLYRRPVAVELNEELVPREKHATVSLHAGDKVEVVTLVGGG